MQVLKRSLVSRLSRRSSLPRDHTLAPTPAVVVLATAPAVVVAATAPVAADVSAELGPGALAYEFFVSLPGLHWNLTVDQVMTLGHWMLLPPSDT